MRESTGGGRKREERTNRKGRTVIFNGGGGGEGDVAGQGDRLKVRQRNCWNLGICSKPEHHSEKHHISKPECSSVVKSLPSEHKALSSIPSTT